MIRITAYVHKGGHATDLSALQTACNVLVPSALSCQEYEQAGDNEVAMTIIEAEVCPRNADVSLEVIARSSTSREQNLDGRTDKLVGMLGEVLPGIHFYVTLDLQAFGASSSNQPDIHEVQRVIADSETAVTTVKRLLEKRSTKLVRPVSARRQRKRSG